MIYPDRLDVWRSVAKCWLLLVLSIGVTSNVAAQVEANSPLARDAAAILEIDGKIADLTTQLRQGQISIAQQKTEASELNAQRAALVLPYGAHNSAPYRALVAEVNRQKGAAAAALRAEKNEAAQLAREKAAEEVKAKKARADAETKAKKEAAVAEQQAKRDALAALELTKKKEAAEAAAVVADDVARDADLRLAQARARFFTDFGKPSPYTADEVKQQDEASRALSAKYLSGGKATLTPAFEQQVQKSYQALLDSRTKQWFVEVFPTVDEVASRISDSTKRSAAFELLKQRLSEHTREPRPVEAEVRLAAYETARVALKADFSETAPLIRDRLFEADVFEPFLPRYSQSLRQKVAFEKAVAAEQARQERLAILLSAVGLLVWGVMLWLPVRLMRLQKFRWPQTQADWEAEVSRTPLPETLRWVDTGTFKYPVTLFSGLIYDKEVWTETNITTTTTTSGGGGFGPNYTPARTTTSTSVSTTVYHRYWMITTEGQQTWHRYSDNEFVATNGQKVSSIWCGIYVLLSYNHATGTVAAPKWWVKGLHKPHYWRTLGWTLLASLALAAAGGFCAGVVVGPGAQGWSAQVDASIGRALGFVGASAIALAIYVALAGAVLGALRTRRFAKKVLPNYVAFLSQYDPQIPDIARVTSGA